MKVYAIFIMLALSLLVGCSDYGDGTDKTNVTVKLSVQVAVGKYLAEDLSRCPKIADVVHDAKQFITGKPVVKALDAVGVLRTQIKWEKLTPEQSHLMNTLITNIEANIAIDNTNGVIPTDTTIPLLAFMDWIDQTNTLACPSESKK